MSEGLIVALVTLAIMGPPAWIAAWVAIRKDRADVAKAVERRVREQVELETEVRELRARQQNNGD